MMETSEEEHEQAIVTSSSSPNSIIDALDSRWSIFSSCLCWSLVLEFIEKPESERVLTPDLEQILAHIAKSGFSR